MSDRDNLRFFAKVLAKSISGQNGTSDPLQLARIMKIKVLYEEPLKIDGGKRISEYRKKKREIVVFYKEHEKEAVAHELFHELELKCKKFSKEESEFAAVEFAKALLNI